MQSEQIDKLTKALVAVQGELRGYSEKSSNPHFKSKYGSLTDVWAAIRGPLTKAGLAVFQTTDAEHADGEVVIVTTLAHESGQWIRGRLRMPYGRGGGPQGAGSAITYARRYALAAICGIAPEDDDAEQAQARSKPAPKSSPPQERDDPVSDEPSHVILFRSVTPEIEKEIGKPVAIDIMKAVRAWNGGQDWHNEVTVEAWLALCRRFKPSGHTLATVKDILSSTKDGDLKDLMDNLADRERADDPITEDDVPF